jgi:hypothetical protein
LTVNTNHVTVPSLDHRLSVWTQWIALRNGGLDNVDDIIAPAFVAHLPRGGGLPEHLGDRQELFAWAAAVRTSFAEFRLSVEVGPILGVRLIAGRWVQSGIARVRGPWGAPGTPVTISGVDIVRLDAGRVAEFWVNQNSFDAAAVLSA